MLADTSDINRIKVNKTINELKRKKLKKVQTQKHGSSEFRMFPKIHKDGNPGTQVASSVYWHTTKYIDHHLQ